MLQCDIPTAPFLNIMIFKCQVQTDSSVPRTASSPKATLKINWKTADIQYAGSGLSYGLIRHN